MHKQGSFSVRFLPLTAVAALILVLTAAACGTGSESDGDDGEADRVTPTATATSVPTATTAADTAMEEGVSIVLQAGLARYLIREELTGVPLPFDAIGETSQVTGALTFTADGDVVVEGSRIVMNAASLRSDEANRDRYLRGNAIETATYPEIIFVMTGSERA